MNRLLLSLGLVLMVFGFVQAQNLKAGTLIGHERIEDYVVDNIVGLRPLLRLNVKSFGVVGDSLTDDTDSLQAALDYVDAQGGGTLHAGPGTYRITDILTIGSNTEFILDKNATILRGGNINSMIINKTNGSGAYGAAKNITIDGGRWDANATNFPTVVTPIGFGHATNITIKNLSVFDVYDWHNVELNAVKGGKILNCHFSQMILNRAYTELVQIDIALGSAQFPWFGPYDKTTCSDITISECTFIDANAAGIGTHSTAFQKLHTNLKIVNNHFENLQREGITGLDYQDLIISGNTFTNCWKGIVLATGSGNTVTGIKITSNIITNMDADTDSRGIHIIGSSFSQKSGSIIGNEVRNIGRHGIGLDYCQGWTVSDNIVTGCTQGGIWIYRSDDCVVSANTLSGNGTSDIIVGSSTGGSTDTKNNIVAANVIESLKVDKSTTTIISNNIIKSSSSIAGDALDAELSQNFIAGVWTAPSSGSIDYSGIDSIVNYQISTDIFDTIRIGTDSGYYKIHVTPDTLLHLGDGPYTALSPGNGGGTPIGPVYQVNFTGSSLVSPGWSNATEPRVAGLNYEGLYDSTSVSDGGGGFTGQSDIDLWIDSVATDYKYTTQYSYTNWPANATSEGWVSNAGDFTFSLRNLTPSTTYSFRVYANHYTYHNGSVSYNVNGTIHTYSPINADHQTLLRFTATSDATGKIYFRVFSSGARASIAAMKFSEIQ